jgi:hypothetical protein
VKLVRYSGGFGVIGFHGVGGDYLETSPETHKELVDYLARHKQDIWVVIFSKLMDYVVAHSGESEDPPVQSSRTPVSGSRSFPTPSARNIFVKTSNGLKLYTMHLEVRVYVHSGKSEPRAG